MGLKDTLLGFADFFRSSVGVGPGKSVRPSPYPKGKKTQAIATHGKVLKAARQVLMKSQGILKKSGAALAKAPLHVPIKAAAKAPAGAAKTAAKAPARAPIHPAMARVLVGAVSRHDEAVAKANAASKTLAQKMIAAKQSMKNLSRAMVAQKKLAVSMRRPKKGKASLVGLAELIGRHDEELSLAEEAEIEDSVGVAEFIGQDDSEQYFDDSGEPVDTSGAPISDGALGDQIDNGDVSFPAPPAMDVAFKDMTIVGGVAYDGSRGFPDGFAGSLGLFTRATDRNIARMTSEIDGNEHHGYVFGQYDWKDPRLSGFGKDSGGSNKQPGGGIPWGSSLHSGLWNWVHGRHEMGSEDWHTDVVNPAPMFGSVFEPSNPGDANHMANSAYGQPFGPIVGNPAMDVFKAMRCDAQGNFFWLPQEAPDWITFPLKQAAALTAKATADAIAAANAAAAAEIAKTQADAAVAAAKQQAEQVAAESAAQSASTVQQAQAEGQAAQVLVEQGRADVDAQKLEMEQARQAGELLLQQARGQAIAPVSDGEDVFQEGDESGVDEGSEIVFDEGIDEGDFETGDVEMPEGEM